MYKLVFDKLNNKESGIIRLDDGANIPFDEANTDYQAFKLALTNGVELQDADGVVMTADQIKTFLDGLK